MSLAGLCNPDQRGKHSLDQVHPRRVIAQCRRVNGHGDRGVCAAHHHAAHRLGEHVLAALVRVRARWPVAAAGRVNDPRIDFPEPVIAKTNSVHDAGAEVADDDVGITNQIVDDRLVCLVTQIQCQRSLVAVQTAENGIVETGLVGTAERRARKITTPGILDFDDVRAEVRKHLRCRRPHHDLRKVDDPNAVERQRIRIAHVACNSLSVYALAASSSIPVAFDDGTSPGSAPCARICFWIFR